ncbi:YegS/Rv2252/BmrU family lipid kinase [Hymenobacter sp. M29]|uniref:YegS/Rv2252/BmrU family lipid kinase n=1 Tax=Hymenobacter mellowenesis TaxID=3063995 RepID=A0ABT9A9T0_9BACT|nr:YegS/Rv2252/BmrU family lipid kinase [Hymenobacter sp. M29]MDO7846288.1 YegS/Rv2252/BmrU family lipid kinase [Hymenobacter sp. M29]
MPKTCFILNPKAGPSRRHDMPGLIARHFGAQEADYEIRHTEYAGHAVELAQRAAAEGFAVVAAVGGDGTVNEVGRGLLGTDAALGIIPQGSGNGLARHLKVPLGLPAALRRLATPDFSRMDVGMMNGHPFFCTAGLGFDAHVSQHFAQAGSRGLSTYLRVTLREYRRYRTVAVEADLNGQQLTADCYVLAFANASQYGNNAYIAPLADLRDGLLDVCLIDALPAMRAFRVSLAMALGTLPQTKAAEYFRVPQARVRAAAPIGFHVDGDYLGHATEFEVELLPLALAVAV